MSNFAKKTGNKRNSLKGGAMSPDAKEALSRRTLQAQIKILNEASEQYEQNGKHIEIIYKRKDQSEIRPSGFYKVDTNIKKLQYREKEQQSWDIVGNISELSDGIIIIITKRHDSINPGRYLFSYYNELGGKYLIQLTQLEAEAEAAAAAEPVAPVQEVKETLKKISEEKKLTFKNKDTEKIAGTFKIMRTEENPNIITFKHFYTSGSIGSFDFRTNIVNINNARHSFVIGDYKILRIENKAVNIDDTDYEISLQKIEPAQGGGRTLQRNLMRKSKRNKKRKRTKNKKRNNKGRNSRKRT